MDNTSPSYEMQTASPSSTGRLRRFLLPPISVILMGGFLALLLSQLQVDQALTAPLGPEQFNSTTMRVEDNGIALFFTPEIQYWKEDILAWSKEFQLDPNLVATVMQIESCGWVEAKSSAGAMGLFQVMPQHFQKKEDPYKPDINAAKGLKYLKKSLDSSGTPRLALAGYNSGITRAKSLEEYWPKETKKYVYWGLKIYQDARIDKVRSNRLNEWLSAGGSSLCKRAAAEQSNETKK